MKNLIIILSLFFSISSCNQEGKNNLPNKNKLIKPLSHYFDFDEVVHYKTDLDSEQARDLINKRNKSKQDTLLLIAVSSLWLPRALTDTNFLNSLETLPFEKKALPNTSISLINNIFKEKVPIDEIEENMCLPLFRDILIFKKFQRINGLAKICFECQQHYIIGTSANTFLFGTQGDYKKLETILKK